MKRTLLVIAVAVGALSAAGIALATGTLNNGPAQIRVYGGGQITTPAPNPYRTISLTVSANPQGREAYGSFRYGRTSGDVTCLSVAGNTALIGGFVRDSPDPTLIGVDFMYAVTDNALPASGADQAGFIDVLPELDPNTVLPADFPRTCPSAAVVTQEHFGDYPLTGDVSIEMP